MNPPSTPPTDALREAIALLTEIRNDPKSWKRGGAGGQDSYAGLPPAMRILDTAIKKLTGEYGPNSIAPFLSRPLDPQAGQHDRALEIALEITTLKEPLRPHEIAAIITKHLQGEKAP